MPFKEPLSYRDNLAAVCHVERSNGNRAFAREYLKRQKDTVVYQVAKRLHQANPSPLVNEASNLHIKPLRFDAITSADTFEPSGGLPITFGFQTSNEYYAGLAERLKGIGGTGIAVGSDQGLDLFIMAHLDKIHIIDIDPETNLITKAYLELGRRLHTVLGRYPTTKEYISLFYGSHQSVLLHLLNTEHKKFDKDSLKELENILATRLGISSIDSYLSLKQQEYGSLSWIGTDENLEEVIKAYEAGRITVHNDNIAEQTVRDFITQAKPSIIYLSNVPEYLHEDGTRETISSWKNTLDQDTLVIFSARNMGRLHAGAIPGAMKDILNNWTFIVFHLKNGWPTKDSLERSREINDGCYEVLPESNPRSK